MSNRTRHRSSFTRLGGGHLTAAVTILLSVSSHITTAAVITAKSVSFPDVAAAVGAATDGDTVTIPAGTESWTSTLVITKGVTLQGAGEDKTVILDDIPLGENRNPLGRRQAKPIDRDSASAASVPLPRRAKSGSGVGRPLVLINVRSRQTFRLTGFTFRYGSRTTKPQNQGCVKIEGTCFSVRVDHCHFDQLYNNSIIVAGTCAPMLAVSRV